ncbi:hypothetical protein BC828DRAFT_40551 [Blastocladiella britannica]|nr:hypothetical protein BC828DRAFT_40551 [Blastocladiella britannica]
MKASKKTPMSRLLKGLRERAKQALSWPAASAAATAARPKALLALPAPPIMVSGADQEQEQEQQQSALMPPLVDSALADDSLADINNGDLHAADNTSATADDFPATADDALATDGDALATDGDAPTAADNGTATADDDDDDDNNDAVLDIFKLFATAQEKMEAEGNDKMIDFIADHLEAMSGRTPLAGSILACLKTFANSGQATHPAIGELYHRVIFVLDLLCHLDKKTNWSKRKSHAVAVLALLEDPIRVCSVLLLAHQQLWFNRQCHGESINNKIKDCDKMLTSALTKVAFLLDLTVVGTLPAIPVTVEFDSVEVGALVVMPQAVELEVAANALPLGEQTFEQGAAAAAADVHPSFDEQFQALDNGFNFAPMEVALLAKTELATLGKHGHRLPPSPPTPPPKDRQLYRKRSSKLDLDADMPNPTLTGTARDIDDATGKVAEAGQEAFQLADYYKEAQEKLDGTEISDTIGAVLGHFQSIANSVPFAGPIFACFKVPLSHFLFLSLSAHHLIHKI